MCVGILALASGAALGAFAALARNARPAAARDAALAVAENALARARAAVAYAASPAQDGPALLAPRSWALRPGTTRFTAATQLRGPALCGTGDAILVLLAVATSYDVAAERFEVVVTYPRDPCRAAAGGTLPADGTATVALSETLPPSAYPPGQVIHRDVPPPARM